MAVFYDIGGDIYAGPTRDAVVAQLKLDCGEDFEEEEMFEIPGTTKIRVATTLAEEYDESLGTYCINSEN